MAAVVSGGCSIHPVPDYIGPDKTINIAKRIRCEARDAVKTAFISKARSSPSLKTRAYAEALAAEKTPITKIDYAALDDQTAAFFRKYDGAGIAYDFRFDITESGGAGGDLDLLRTISGGSISLGVNARSDLMRQNLRTFLLNDTFIGLLTTMTAGHCQGYETGENWLYPITGSIGLAEMVKAFIQIDETGAFVPREGQDAATLIDTLEFTTQFSVSAQPSLVLAPAGRRWQTTGLSAGQAGIGAGRIDKNKVAISISAEVPKEEVVAEIVVAPRADARPRAHYPARVDVRPVEKPIERPNAASQPKVRARTPSEINATRAIQNQNLLQFYDNTRRLSDEFGLPSF
ncbi:hypothetical protein [Bosea sp. (in: a-proteobacteria)]|uniref:hypothetical protein n=1 Tax=Bosea sp. (in: a-proteobacteria) TaxID=1871050 RepID=UPI002DDD8286|nr:hypothetical protein [Bosea sp. (in: a-proteobacteria)]